MAKEYRVTFTYDLIVEATSPGEAQTMAEKIEKIMRDHDVDYPEEIVEALELSSVEAL